ncbi:MAG: T9SS type A sorting domain-containing protein, partial [Salibacteraceae bacterium]|nr:T9SS type A sorting domain-containing protein [Salibacteraceae bacterium]
PYRVNAGLRWTEDEKEVVLLGTSVGVFSTREINADSTIWKQEGASTVGNVVVDMIDYRAADGWIVLATHGNGMYAANMKFETPEGIASAAENVDFSIYPNPTNGILHFSLKANEKPSQVAVFTLGGKLVMSQKNTAQLDVSQLPTGAYILKATINGKTATRKFMKI